MADTKIEWTDVVWNPVTGCTKVSQGCKNCYAEGIADRFFAKQYPPNADGSLRKFTDVRCHEDRLDAPLHWKKPRRVFVNSMSDLFHEDVPFEFIDKVFIVMGKCPQHTFQILTKRPGRMLDYANQICLDWANVWLGVSVEDRKTWLERSAILKQVPATVRFISCEPALGDLGEIDLTGIHWMIVGGESGPDARPMHPDWVRSVRDQCVAAGVPFFLKQWGEWMPSFNFSEQFKDVNPKTPCMHLAADGHTGNSIAEMQGHRRTGLVVRIGKKAAGRLLDGREWDEYPSLQASAP